MSETEARILVDALPAPPWWWSRDYHGDWVTTEPPRPGDLAAGRLPEVTQPIWWVTPDDDEWEADWDAAGRSEDPADHAVEYRAIFRAAYWARTEGVRRIIERDRLREALRRLVAMADAVQIPMPTLGGDGQWYRYGLRLTADEVAEYQTYAAAWRQVRDQARAALEEGTGDTEGGTS